MYGTIARMKVKPGMLDAMMAWGDNLPDPDEANIMLIYRSDHDPNELWMVVAAESREAYHAQAQSPEQHEIFTEMMQFLVEEPEWHDGEVIREIVV
jgi:hypothetical protein